MKVGLFDVKELPEDTVTGTLENWYVDSLTFAPAYTVIRGYIYGDINTRFYNGEFIRTSALAGDDFSSLKPGDYVRTLNSRYLLGKERVE